MKGATDRVPADFIVGLQMSSTDMTTWLGISVVAQAMTAGWHAPITWE